LINLKIAKVLLPELGRVIAPIAPPLATRLMGHDPQMKWIVVILFHPWTVETGAWSVLCKDF